MVNVPNSENEEIELDDDALEHAAAGTSDSGESLNSTIVVFGSTFIPFDSSF